MPRIDHYISGLLRLLAAIVFLATNAPAVSAVDQTPPADPDQVLTRIKARTTTVKTLVASFRQERFSRLLEEPLISEGLIYFERDGMILMQVDTPSSLQLLIEGQSVTVVDAELGLVKKMRLSRLNQTIKTWLAWDAPLEHLKQQYDLQLTEQLNHKRYKLQMTPKAANIARHITAIEVQVSADVLLPEQIIIKSTKGDRTSVRLRFVSINEPLPDGIFDIEIPELFQNDR